MSEPCSVCGGVSALEHAQALIHAHELLDVERSRAQTQAASVALATAERAERIATAADVARDKLFAEILHRLDTRDGAGGGLRAGWGYLLGSAVLVATIINVLTFLVRCGK